VFTVRLDRSKLARLSHVEAAAQIGAAVQLGELKLEDGLELARAIALPDQIRAALERSLQPPAGASAESLRAGFFVPISGKKYRIELSPGQSFYISYGPKLAQDMFERRLKVDQSTGQLVDIQGRPDPRCPVARARKYYFELTGQEPPSWILLHPVANSFYRPKVQVELELGAHIIQVTDRGPPQFLFLHRLDDAGPARRWSKAELAPLEAHQYQPLSARTLYASFEAPNRESLEKLTALFEKIVEPAARRATVPKDLSPEELLKKNAPTQIIVVPRGKHYSAMPQLADIRVMLQKKEVLGDAATILLRDADRSGFVRYLFVPEEDLASPTARDTKHELYHLLEDRYLSAETLAAVDALWRRTVRKGGPFSRAYGMQREEFFTTMSEEFEGSHGEEGKRWLAENHSELEEVYRRVTRPLLN
jgi:hypothetical protein